MNSSRKYYPLYKFLQDASQDKHLNVTFSEVEEKIGSTLPRSARSTRAWWANTPSAQSEAWLSVGWIVEYVDFINQIVTFRPKKVTYRLTAVRRRPGWTADKIKELRDFAGWTQQDLANKMGVRQQTVSEWETGMHAPRFSTSKHLNLIAKEAQFPYQVEDKPDVEPE